MREVSLERYFTRGVEARGGAHRKLVTPGRRHAPDRLVIWPSDHALIDFVELKKPGEKPRAGQVREHRRLRKLGCNVFVIASHLEAERYFSMRGR